MEGALTARDRVGIQDFVLLDAHTSETAFLGNLKKRFSEDLIYTYIGTLLVSVNPYKELDIYSKKQMDIYMGVNFFELPPHIYALADNAYHTMMTEANNHFILISGESGAGKTEASKKILQYYAVSCPSTTLLDSVRDRMLVSNPVLEAFGNAKTLKNDNSSRFGKYMDIQFDIQGDAVGGHILSYLLEKSRVVHQNHGERNFHIFYQLVEGGEEDLLTRLHILLLCVYVCVRGAAYTQLATILTLFLTLTLTCLHSLQHLFGIIASVLHLGNVQFEADSKGYATLNKNTELRWVSTVSLVILWTLCNDTIPFTVDHAIYARNALAKAIYGRTFTWLVNKINDSMENKEPSRKTVIGLLDIYGFEVFYVNSFEQFCINYCNEKLQQLFIQLTLKSEQEEYEAEGIGEKHRGIISVLVRTHKWQPIHYLVHYF
uniref:Myosin IH n=1 Tax=Hucho hucho TaxID=62062 RepID=A0A4W5QBH5_9TELE